MDAQARWRLLTRAEPVMFAIWSRVHCSPPSGRSLPRFLPATSVLVEFDNLAAWQAQRDVRHA
jgi:hypothetical protein